MKLSFIVPVYNVEEYLCRCVDSILNQTLDDYEIILVDDASPDSCPEICDNYAEQYPDIVNVIHQENRGLAGARNSGLKEAQGDYIYFFDSDDFFTGDGMSEIYRKAKDLDVDILQNSFIIHDEIKNTQSVIPSEFEVEKIYSHSEMQKKICVSTTERSTIFVWRNIYKRSFLEKNKILFDEKLRMIEDSPFNTLAFLRADRFAAVNKPIYAYRIRNDSLQRKKFVADYDKVLEYQWNLRRKIFSENSDNDNRFYADFAEYMIKANFPMLLSNFYHSDVKDKYAILKRIGDSEMMRKSFEDYDINEFKSRSLDWWMTWLVKKRWYLPAHFLCKKVLYTN